MKSLAPLLVLGSMMTIPTSPAYCAVLDSPQTQANPAPGHAPPPPPEVEGAADTPVSVGPPAKPSEEGRAVSIRLATPTQSLRCYQNGVRVIDLAFDGKVTRLPGDVLAADIAPGQRLTVVPMGAGLCLLHVDRVQIDVRGDIRNKSTADGQTQR